MPTLTIFANFWISDDERFLRMQDSFHSFMEIESVNWVVNVRGTRREDTVAFLRERLGERLVARTLESGRGWFHDTRQMLNDIHGDYVLFWVEDHINLAPVSVYPHILQEMADTGTEYLNYSWWFNGLSNSTYSHIPKVRCDHIEAFELNRASAERFDMGGRVPFLISMPSIFSQRLFKKIVLTDDPRLRRWPKETPFDFEKKGTDFHWLPLRMAISRQELFACIDDDNGVPDYSLQARGLYPKRARREQKPRLARWKWLQVLASPIPLAIKKLLQRISYHIG